jgi:hypothetical protein
LTWIDCCNTTKFVCLDTVCLQVCNETHPALALQTHTLAVRSGIARQDVLGKMFYVLGA